MKCANNDFDTKEKGNKRERCKKMSDRLTGCYAILEMSMRCSKLAIASIFFGRDPLFGLTVLYVIW